MPIGRSMKADSMTFPSKVTPGGFPRLSQAPSQPDISPNESAVLPDRQRRIDRILLPSSYLQNLLECYCTFLGGSDHKIVVARIAPLKRHANKLKHCPTTFLSCADTVSAVGEKLEAIPTEGYARWADALSLIRSSALHFEAKHRAEQGFSEIQALLMDSTVQ